MDTWPDVQVRVIRDTWPDVQVKVMNGYLAGYPGESDEWILGWMSR